MSMPGCIHSPYMSLKRLPGVQEKKKRTEICTIFPGPWKKILYDYLQLQTYRLDFQPLFGKQARAPPPGRNKDRTRESGGNQAYKHMAHTGS